MTQPPGSTGSPGSTRARRARGVVSAALACAVLVLTSCGTTPTAADTTLTVFAAASLGESFEELADGFEAEHPDIEVEYNFAGSSSLAEQILAGAPADVFASANESTMATVTEAGEEASDPEIFASNVLTLITPPDNPAGIESLQDLDGPAAEDLRLVVCAPQVPCGDATATLAEDAGADLTPVSEESQVTDVLGKVTSGEADAGLVYVTDATGAGDAVHSIALENADSAVNSYPISVLRASEKPHLAREFIDYVRSEAGQTLLEDHGFGPAQ